MCEIETYAKLYDADLILITEYLSKNQYNPRIKLSQRDLDQLRENSDVCAYLHVIQPFQRRCFQYGASSVTGLGTCGFLCRVIAVLVRLFFEAILGLVSGADIHSVGRQFIYVTAPSRVALRCTHLVLTSLRLFMQ